MQAKLTRRQLAAAILAKAQVQPSPEELLAAEKEEMRRAIEQLDKLRLPMATEPSFRFEA